MKAQVFFAVSILSIVTLYGQSNKFDNAMLTNFDLARSARSINDFQELANVFARIAEAEKSEWTPFYYAAFYNLSINFQDSVRERKEKYIALAQRQIDAGLKIKPDETELYVLKVMSYYAEMAIDPMKGMTLLGEANALIDKAKKINPGNPRIYLLEAEAIFNMPAEFGGGKEKALPVLLLAKEKFDNFVIEGPLSPSWGQDRCELLIGEAVVNK